MYGFLISCAVTLAVIFAADAQRNGPSFMTSCGNSSTLTNIYSYGHYCHGILSSWYRDRIQGNYYYYRQPDDKLRFQNTTHLWGEICRWNFAMAKCYESILPECNEGIGIELLNNPRFLALVSGVGPREGDYYENTDSLLGFYRRTCQGETVKPEIQQRIDDNTFDVNTTCINGTDQLEINRCLRIYYEDDLDQNLYATSSASKNRINQLAESAINCMYSAINRSPCNQATKRVMYHVAKLQIPSFIDERELNLDESTMEDFSALLRCTVGVYGDPHLRMCFEPGLTTCSAEGPQILIANGWFLVTGEHKRIGRPGRPVATSLRSIQIIFQSLDTTSTVAIYSASNGNLPLGFDGTNATTAGQGSDEVTLILDGRRREFIQHSTGMILALRQWNGNYFFTLRIAQNVVKRSYGLLATGCPEGEVIARSSWQWFRPARLARAVTMEECEMACNETIDVEMFRSSCIFDCFATENPSFVNMTLEAVNDTKVIEQRDVEIRKRALSRPKQEESNPNSAPGLVNNYNVIFSVLAFVTVHFLRSCTH